MKRSKVILMILVLSIVFLWSPDRVKAEGTADIPTAADHEHAWGEDKVCSVCGAQWYAEGTCGTDLTWTLNADGVLDISGSGSMAWYNSPPWHSYMDEIKEIHIGSGVTTIGLNAFYECTGLKSVDLPDSVTELGSSAFAGCSALTSVTIGDSLHEISEDTFLNCSSLSSIRFPDSLRYIYDNAFGNCTSLRDISFGELSSTYISDDAFTNVTATVHYPEGNVTWSDSKLQDYGGALTWVAYEVDPVEGICGDNITWVLDDGVLTITGTGLMYDGRETEYGYEYIWDKCSRQIVTVNMSDGISNIGDYAFYDCSNLKTIDLPNSLTVIGDYAFYDCSNLKTIDLPNSLTVIGDHAFSICGNLEAIDLPNSLAVIEEYAFSNTGIKNIVIPEGIVEIAPYTFQWTDLDSITFPSTLKRIKEGAFEWGGAENVYVPSMEVWCGIEFDPFFANPFLETLEDNLYVNGELTKNIVIPDGVTKIGVDQFAGYSSMESVQIPDSVTRIEEGAFSLPGSAMRGEPMLTEIVFPASVEYIGLNALAIQDNLRKIVILNPDCELACEFFDYELNIHTGIYESYFNRPFICGYPGSTAEAYAELEGFDFISLENLTPFKDVQPGAFYTTAANWAVAQKITSGTSATTFSPMKNCTRADVVTFLWRANGSPAPESANNPFTDVENGQYYTDAVLWAVEQGITKGIDVDKFGTLDTVTRGQFVTFLWRAKGCPEIDDWNPFSDVGEDQFYSDAILWAVQNHITNGITDTTFEPEQLCTRGQVVTFLYRAYG